MNPYLDDDLVALADQARRFATDRIAPGYQGRERTRGLDRGIVSEMARWAHRAGIARGLGGLGSASSRRRHRRGGRARRPHMAYVNLLASLNGKILSPHGTPAVGRPWWRLAAGEASSPSRSPSRAAGRTPPIWPRVERDGNRYVLKGEKSSICMADQADAAVVLGGPDRSNTARVASPPCSCRWTCRGRDQPLRRPAASHRPRLVSSRTSSVPASHRLGDKGEGLSR